MGAKRRPASAPFSESPDQALLIDAIAHRYHRLPHEVLSLTPEQLSMAIACLTIRNEEDAANAKRSGAMPMVVVNG